MDLLPPQFRVAFGVATGPKIPGAVLPLFPSIHGEKRKTGPGSFFYFPVVSLARDSLVFRLAAVVIASELPLRRPSCLRRRPTPRRRPYPCRRTPAPRRCLSCRRLVVDLIAATCHRPGMLLTNLYTLSEPMDCPLWLGSTARWPLYSTSPRHREMQSAMPLCISVSAVLVKKVRTAPICKIGYLLV